MKIANSIDLIRHGTFAESAQWQHIRASIHEAIKQAEWPVGRGQFIIYPESGKKSGQGNGVVPIKAKPMQLLKADGWSLEYPWSITTRSEEQEAEQQEKSRKGSKPGNIDAAKQFDQGLVVVEWETGNVSSSHRSINKMALGLIQGKCIAGVLVVPNMKLARYLTDRIGNIEELTPYFPVWRKLDVEGVLELIVIEQDDESLDVPKIPKGKDGRSKEGAAKAQKKSVKKDESK